MFSIEIENFLKKMHEMDKNDENNLKNQIEETFDNDIFVTLQTDNFVYGLDPKEIKLSEALFEDFESLSELFGEEEVYLFEEFKKAEKLLDERYSIKSTKIPQVYLLKKI